VGPGAGLDRCGKSCPTGIRSPDLPARSESLYRLSYPGSHLNYIIQAVFFDGGVMLIIVLLIPTATKFLMWPSTKYSLPTKIYSLFLQM
jgi:hypothetical protein